MRGTIKQQKALTSMTPEEVIEEMKISGLRGRGGAGFPTWFKWNAARQNEADQKYMVCNADEEIPALSWTGAFWKEIPFLLEGMIIGAYAIGASEGVIYVRANIPLPFLAWNCHGASQRKGYLGKNILGSGFLSIFASKPAQGFRLR